MFFEFLIGRGSDNYLQSFQNSLMLFCVQRINNSINIYFKKQFLKLIIQFNIQLIFQIDFIILIQGFFFDGIPSFCQQHPEDLQYLKKYDDFRKLRPNGGCQKPCKSRLNCGHSCKQLCHILNTHDMMKCNEKCKKFQKNCTQNHPCQKLCHQECNECKILVSVDSSCGHTKQIICSQAKNQKYIEKQFCSEIVKYKFEKCDHTDIKCGDIKDPFCNKKCLIQQKFCGHKCQGICGQCRTDNAHQKCQFKCEKLLKCGHYCQQDCHGEKDCQICDKKCMIYCQHSKCEKNCTELCSSCLEKCSWECEHQGGCNLPCGAPCNRLPCDKRCQKILECNHQCPSVCGEICPDKKFCQQCGTKKSEIIDVIEFQKYEDIDLNIDPIIVLSCEHFFPISTLDQHMEIEKAYKKDQEMWQSCLQVDPDDFNWKNCMICKNQIKSIYRYGRIQKCVELNFLNMKLNFYLQREINKTQNATSKLQDLLKLLQMIKDNPTNQVFVYEASGGSTQIIIKKPPSKLMIVILQQLSLSFHDLYKCVHSMDYIELADEYITQSIEIACQGKYFKDEAENRIIKARIILSKNYSEEKKQKLITEQCNQVIDSKIHAVTQEQRNEAQRLIRFSKGYGTITEYEKKQIFQAIRNSSGGTWYQCQNYHPYFIGECGGAMQIGRCNECGAQIGGQNHRLLGNNQIYNQQQNN